MTFLIGSYQCFSKLESAGNVDNNSFSFHLGRLKVHTCNETKWSVECWEIVHRRLQIFQTNFFYAEVCVQIHVDFFKGLQCQIIIF